MPLEPGLQEGPRDPSTLKLPACPVRRPDQGGSQEREGTGQETVGMLLALAWLSALGKVTSFLS